MLCRRPPLDRSEALYHQQVLLTGALQSKPLHADWLLRRIHHCFPASLAVSRTNTSIIMASKAEPASSAGKNAEKKGRLMIYGATGHTGKLVARKAKEVGLNATLAGRNEEKLK